MRTPASALLLVLVVLAGCREFDAVLGGTSPHEQYMRALEDAGLGRTALAVAWRDAAEAALAAPVEVEAPFEEVAYFDPARPEAAGYRLALQRGQQLRVRAERDGPDSTRLFLDLFALPEDTTRAPSRVAGADAPEADTLAFTYEAGRDGGYVLRLQPELLRGGRVRLVVEAGASLGFPVAGHTSAAVRSVFGDPRDGGARRHEGIDIFAPRGTPVVAAADGTVSRVGEGGLGGKTVWLSARGYGLYYAHLDSQLVTRGERVRRGDTLGLVGNTGNARSTPPHLHFGVYARGAVDPYPFVHEPAAEAVPVRADTAALGRWVRLTTRTTVRRTSGSERAEILPAQTALRPVAARGRSYRVALPDGTTGYVEARSTSVDPLCALRLTEGRLLYAAPAGETPAIDSLGTDVVVDALGHADGFLLVVHEGRQGWISDGGLRCRG